MGKYVELALTLREQRLKDDEAAMASIRDKFLTDVAEQIGREGYARFDLGCSKPEWWNYNYNGDVLVRWAREEGFDVSVDRWCGYGKPHLIIVQLGRGYEQC